MEGICRLCGERDLKVIDIYSKEGMEDDIPNKIKMYIPKTILDPEDLPYSCCLPCISTIVSWHNFVMKVIETNQQISSLKEDISSSSATNDFEQRDISKPSCTSLQVFHLEPKNQSSKEDTDNCTEEADIYSYIKVEFEEAELRNRQQKKQKITEQPHHLSSDVKSKKRFSHNDKKLQNICDDSRDKKSKILREVRSKINPEMIEAAKVTIGDRTYYNCKECNKSLLSPYTYVWHMRIHTGERPFMCDLCGKQFRVSQGLARHLKETHKRIKNYPCDLCGRMFATKRNVEEHRRTHTNERPYVCALCSKSFKQKASLFVHNRTHTDKFPFKCDYCNQGFRTKSPLLIHVTKHTGQKPYPCDICGRFFRIKYELKRHQLVHSEEKPFVCSSCGLRFKQKRYLMNHFKANHADGT